MRLEQAARLRVTSLKPGLRRAAPCGTRTTPTDCARGSALEYLRWRYGLPTLRYRILTAGPTVEDGAAVFRLRRRGEAVEAVICDLLVPGDQPKTREGSFAVEFSRLPARTTRSALGRPRSAGGFVPLPGPGTVAYLAGAYLHDDADASHDWDLSLGDVELF